METERRIKNSTELRREIERTKSSLTGHLEELEAEVRVNVDKVKNAFGLREKIIEHPEIAMGLSVLAGACLSQLGSSSKRQRLSSSSSPQEFSEGVPFRTRSRGVVGFLKRHFRQELRNLSVLGMGMLLSTAKDWIEKGTSKEEHLSRSHELFPQGEDGDFSREAHVSPHALQMRLAERQH